MVKPIQMLHTSLTDTVFREASEEFPQVLLSLKNIFPIKKDTKLLTSEMHLIN